MFNVKQSVKKKRLGSRTAVFQTRSFGAASRTGGTIASTSDSACLLTCPRRDSHVNQANINKAAERATPCLLLTAANVFSKVTSCVAEVFPCARNHRHSRISKADDAACMCRQSRVCKLWLAKNTQWGAYYHHSGTNRACEDHTRKCPSAL